MAEPFKLLINRATVAHTAQHLQRAWAGFDAARFERLATEAQDSLELKARAMRIADALQATLPDTFGRACDVLEAALAPPLPIDAQGEPIGLQNAPDGQGISGWALWGAGEWVARAGMADAPRALACLHALTQRFSAEFAIRPFIAHRPEAVWPVLRRWVDDDSAHVRRLVSEGSRPRLPWGLRLQALVADPSPTLPLLRALQDDPSAYVRRSVANHLNDIAKDHPETVADWVRTHRVQTNPAREALLRHASRSLIKQGHGPTLQAWGLQPGLQGKAVLTLSTTRARLGDELGLRAWLRSSAAHEQALVVDWVMHYQRAHGRSSAKVFKGWKLTLGAGAEVVLDKRHALRDVSIRRHHPGLHRVELQVNGAVVAQAAFDLHM